jgi:hypothetical protein
MSSKKTRYSPRSFSEASFLREVYRAELKESNNKDKMIKAEMNER